MIGPDGIKRKAENLYPEYQRAWLNGETFFPKIIPSERKLDANLSVASQSVQLLRNSSREHLGYGYTIEWKEINSPIYGRNHFPSKILFETEQDFLRLIGKETEFSRFKQAVTVIRARYPLLDAWIRSHRQDLTDAVDVVDQLLLVVDYFAAHPRPNLYARELPLPLDTKFVERNERILRQWLDLILPPHTIRADENHFARRFGLKYAETLIVVRFLDQKIQDAYGCPWEHIAIPLQGLAERPVSAERVIIVENMVPLLTLPKRLGTIALGAMGNGVTDLRYLPWLSQRPLWYWGDIDVEGFEILSRLRIQFPNLVSLMMNQKTLDEWHRGGEGNRKGAVPLPNLTPGEQQAYRICCEQNRRLEQEHISVPFVAETLAAVWGPSV